VVAVPKPDGWTSSAASALGIALRVVVTLTFTTVRSELLRGVLPTLSLAVWLRPGEFESREVSRPAPVSADPCLGRLECDADPGSERASVFAVVLSSWQPPGVVGHVQGQGMEG
jgi:hypothetical protein